MTRTRPNPWMSIGLTTWRLGMEASAVMGVRALKIAQGGAAGRAETKRMVAEKIEAAHALQTLAMSGRLGGTPASATAKTLAHYRRKVAANRRRLTHR